MKNKWKFEDIIDLEYFSNIDLFREDLQAKDFHRRDRQFFIDGQRSGDLNRPSHFQCLFAWLAHRRMSEANQGGGFFPGSRLTESLHLFRWMLVLCGLLVGSSAALSYFVYTGQTPLNVFTFYTLFILPQLALIVFFLLRSVFVRLTRGPRSLLKGLLVPMFHRFAIFFKKRTQSHLREEQQQSFNLLFSAKKNTLFLWPLFSQAQLFGIAFNIGLLLITFFKITTADLAFGWQTTLNLGADGLNTVVHFVALPWSWLLPDQIFVPTLEQIEGSRIILKDGISNLNTENLTSWWPFLLLSLLCYGLVPRLLLFCFGVWGERRHYKQLLNKRKFQAITQRMRTPLVSSQAAAEKTSDNIADLKQRSDIAATIRQNERINGCTLLVPDELYGNIDSIELNKLFLNHGFEIQEQKLIFRSYEEDKFILEHIDQTKNGVAVLVEAWMPPIVEHLLFLEKLSQRLGSKDMLVFCLLGKPDGKGLIGTPHLEATRLWREKLNKHCDAAVIFELEEPLRSIEVHG